MTETISNNGFLGGSVEKNPPANIGDLGLIPRSGKSPGGRNGNPFQYSCLKQSHGQRSLAGYSPRGYKKLDTAEHKHDPQGSPDMRHIKQKSLKYVQRDKGRHDA